MAGGRRGLGLGQVRSRHQPGRAQNELGPVRYEDQLSVHVRAWAGCILALGLPMTQTNATNRQTDALTEALRQQQDDDEAHDRSLIVERLQWTSEERLAANASFLRFYLSVRPEGPLIRE